jgi:hypothetical protein
MAWGAMLNGVYLSGGTNDVVIDHRPAVCAEFQEVGCMGEPPDGLGGLPGPLRTEDVVYAQRDGARHFNDWYPVRLVTITGNIQAGVCGCTDAAADAQALMQAWKRTNEDIELVIFPDCYTSGVLSPDPDTDPVTYSYQFPWGFGVGGFGEGPFGGENEDQMQTGPFGIVGRPRIADGKWLPGKAKIYQFTLRFDAVGPEIYILDPCGTPGFARCTDIYPENNAGCVMEPLCSPICATGQSGPVVNPTTVSVGGTEVVYPELTLWPNLTNPIVENLTTLDYITYDGTITDYPVFINTQDMTATQNGVSVTDRLGGMIQWPLSPGDFEVRLLSQSNSDTGHLTVCARDTLVSI